MWWGSEMRLFTAVLIGLIFGLGIAISGMINPAKVLNFFDITGTWTQASPSSWRAPLPSPSPAIATVLGRPAPPSNKASSSPDTRVIDRRLILGSAAAFGVGWGIAGFCPGGALAGHRHGRSAVFLFLAALIGGLLIARVLQSRAPARKPA